MAFRTGMTFRGYGANQLVELYEMYEIEKAPNPGRQHELYQAMTVEWNLMTDPEDTFTCKEIRDKINNIKGAPARKKYKQGQILEKPQYKTCNDFAHSKFLKQHDAICLEKLTYKQKGTKLAQMNSNIPNQNMGPQEVENLKSALHEANKKISSLCTQLSHSETQTRDLSKENAKLASQIKDQAIFLGLYLEEISDLKETLSDKASKVKLQQQKIKTFEENMKTLMNIVLPHDRGEPTFFNLRNELEYLKGMHTIQKEEIEILRVINFPNQGI